MLHHEINRGQFFSFHWPSFIEEKGEEEEEAILAFRYLPIHSVVERICKARGEEEKKNGRWWRAVSLSLICYADEAIVISFISRAL